MRLRIKDFSPMKPCLISGHLSSPPPVNGNRDEAAIRHFEDPGKLIGHAPRPSG
jgi:hypothetical protein